MGVMDWLRSWRSSDTASVTSWPVLDYLTDMTEGKSADDLWREQPHLRTVIGFLTRNVAQLGLAGFKISADGTRQRKASGKLKAWLIKPNSDQTMYEFLESLVGDIALYDNAYVTVFAVERDGQAVVETRTVRPTWVQAVTGLGPYSVSGYQIKYPEDTKTTFVPAENVIHFHGYNPVDARVGVSPISSLRSNLSEQIHAVAFRDQLWKRGGRVGSFLTRPADAPAWDPAARQKFKRDFASAWSGDSGSQAGGVPLLEDGMELKRVGFSAHEEEFVEATKLSLTQVAAAYYINPTMVGILDNANYSNVREFRRMLYGETLGPLLEMIQQRLTAFLLPHMDVPVDGRTVVAFDVEGRTAGTFEEQIGVATEATGSPVMTVNEFRSRLGLAPVEGGDELVQPLNITKPGDHDPIEADPDTGPGSEDDADADNDPPEADPPLPDDDTPDTDKSGPTLDLKILEELLSHG
ncbi:portal protein [Gordonia phage Trine]|uniref:Portal protein n=1 Tax=Gordonia phage Trine TaxID=2201431 RepID=A0A2Z4Q9E8_9CAUD|nr:portal protein [Gordonia phage Trine]AWY06505.1 portal protein [Gordonia phage Trine]